MDLETYKKNYEEDSTPGWDAIDTALKSIYGDQQPQHWGTMISHALGGPDPIDGISAYQCDDGGQSHLHFCTYGYTSLYFDTDSVGSEFSKYGFEMTFRLATDQPADQAMWVCNLFQNIARYVFQSGRWFEPFHYLPANGPIKADSDTQIVGLAFLLDPKLRSINTPHGKVDFIQAFGITQHELDAIKDSGKTAEFLVTQHAIENPLLITDLERP